jgi:hypothetical protein
MKAKKKKRPDILGVKVVQQEKTPYLSLLVD